MQERHAYRGLAPSTSIKTFRDLIKLIWFLTLVRVDTQQRELLDKR